MTTPRCRTQFRRSGRSDDDGNHYFKKAIGELKRELESGAWDEKKFRFQGRELEQSHDNRSITISMSLPRSTSLPHPPRFCPPRSPSSK